ncbi:MAG: diguanylate cyclase [Rhodospirillaceae bacterium]
MGRWISIGWRVSVVAAVLASAVLPPEPALAADPPRHVRIQLKWTHQFQFAGYYAAVEKGWFREAGLDVDLVAGGPAIDPAKVVATGGAQFGVGNSSLIIDRDRGMPLVAVAAVFQHSPFILLARRTAKLNTPRDLVGRTVMVEEHASELIAYLKREGVALGQINVVPHGGSPLVLAPGGGVDALTAYSTTEPYDLIRSDIPFQEFSPRSVGIDYYGDTLFTTQEMAARSPELVRAVRAVTLRGWIYALEHSDEVIELILSRYNPGLDRRKLEFEAEEIRRLMLFDVVDVGYMSTARWHHIAEGFAAAGLLKSAAIPADFLFDSPEQADLVWLYGGLAGAVALAVGLFAVVIRFRRLNLALWCEIASRRQLEDQLQQLAATDPLTGALNRRSFRARAEEELARARRFRHPLAVLALDLDHFKSVNDRWGHSAGDRLLRAFSDCCRSLLRQSDAFGRFGGEEFFVLLPETALEGAVALAERIRLAVAGMTIVTGGGEAIGATVSIGVAGLADAPSSIDALLGQADAALYTAKHNGRNRVALAEPVV